MKINPLSQAVYKTSESTQIFDDLFFQARIEINIERD